VVGVLVLLVLILIPAVLLYMVGPWSSPLRRHRIDRPMQPGRNHPLRGLNGSSKHSCREYALESSSPGSLEGEYSIS